jgi:hypothetical protein
MMQYTRKPRGSTRVLYTQKEVIDVKGWGGGEEASSATGPRALRDARLVFVYTKIRRRKKEREKYNIAYLSRTASCQRCSFATSFTWNPKIRGRYRSARSATAAVLIASPRASEPSTSSSRGRPRRRGSSTVAPAPGTMPTAPVARAASVGPLLGGRREG